MAALPGSAPLSASRAGSNPLAGYVRGYAWLRPDRRTFFESLAPWCGASCANWPCLYLEPTARQSLNLWGSRGSNSPQADYEPAAFTRLLDPRPVAATILEARRPPWSAPKHADHSRAGPKNAAGRRVHILRVFQGCHAAGQSAGPQAHVPLHRCKAAPASQVIPPPDTPSCWPTGRRRCGGKCECQTPDRPPGHICEWPTNPRIEALFPLGPSAGSVAYRTTINGSGWA